MSERKASKMSEDLFLRIPNLEFENTTIIIIQEWMDRDKKAADNSDWFTFDTRFKDYLSDFFVFLILRFGSCLVNVYIKFLMSHLIVASADQGSLLTAKQKLTIAKFNKVWKYMKTNCTKLSVSTGLQWNSSIWYPLVPNEIITFFTQWSIISKV